VPNFLSALRHLPKAEIKRGIAQLSQREVETLLYDWSLLARENQIAPTGNWRTWLVMAGRGFGKTRVGAEWVRGEVESKRRGRIALIAPTASDARDVMVEGESGILAISPNWDRPLYEPSKRRLTWRNGAIATTYSADEPDRLRGPQHDGAWCDELAAWKYPEAWDMLLFGLRLGVDPRSVVTTTPRPTKIIRDLAKSATTHVTRGSTFDNRANLAQAFLEEITRKYEGTRLGRQELNAEILDDNPNALWQRAAIDALRVKEAPPLKRVVVGIDPSVTGGSESDECGIVCAGLGIDGHGYVLDDLSLVASPDGWARVAVRAYHDRKADRIVAEVNNGGEMVELVIRTVDRNVSYKAVHASRGKMIRAEPIAALYEQSRVHHVGGFPKLEDQMVEYDPNTATHSPDRMDALVWVMTELFDTSTTGLIDFYAAKAAKPKKD